MLLGNKIWGYRDERASAWAGTAAARGPRPGAVIVGWGHTPFGRSEYDLEGLIHDAAREALSSSGLAASEIGGIWLGHFNSGLVKDAFCSSMALGIDSALRFKPAVRLENACASGGAALFGAIDAIESGRVRTALVIGAEKMTGLNTAGVTQALGGASYQRDEAGMSFPEIFARFATAYGDRFGDPSEALAHIAVKNHSNAMSNPLAQMHRPLTIEFCRAISERNPLIAPPLKLSDCSLVSDGAAAMVLVARDMAGAFPRAVGFRGVAHVSDLLPLSAKDLSEFAGPARAIQGAYAQAGVGVDDISLAEVHDCFTIAELMMAEAMGLCSPGQAAAAVIAGETAPDGRLPVNLSGGLKAKGHPVGATGVSMHVLNARQLVGDAGGMQHKAPKLGRSSSRCR